MIAGLSVAKNSELRRIMRKHHVYEKDLQESFIRSSGPGGQNINKVATCVHLIHGPTGFAIKCQKFRTQALNRYHARVLLVNKIEKETLSILKRDRQAKEKLKRQKRKRSKAQKERMLKNKKKQSEKKASRSKIQQGKLHKYL